MKNTKTNYLLEHSSLAFILSYFIIHNIFLVLIGIILSIYSINMNNIKKTFRSIKQIFAKSLNKDDKSIKHHTKEQTFYIKESKHTLVEAVEELGFIPSMDNNDKINSL